MCSLICTLSFLNTLKLTRSKDFSLLLIKYSMQSFCNLDYLTLTSPRGSSYCLSIFSDPGISMSCAKSLFVLIFHSCPAARFLIFSCYKRDGLTFFILLPFLYNFYRCLFPGIFYELPNLIMVNKSWLFNWQLSCALILLLLFILCSLYTGLILLLWSVLLL